MSYVVQLQDYCCFFDKIYFHKTTLQKNHTYNTNHTICKKKEKKAKKRLEVLKEGTERKWCSHDDVIQTIQRHNPFKLFSLYTFYVID